MRTGIWQCGRWLSALAVATALLTVVPDAVAAPDSAQFGDGTKIVGVDIAPGTYRLRAGSPGCYWERLSGFGGTLGEIIANENTDNPEVVTIASTDAGFNSQGCGEWTNDLSAITNSPTAPFAAGTYLVGVDVAPGTWRASGGSGCYWGRLSGFGGTLAELIANDFTDSPAIVTISPGDSGFRSDSCGTWTKVR